MISLSARPSHLSLSWSPLERVRPVSLSAAGYGEFDPADSNDTREGKSHNRRTEITLQPNIDEIVAVPEAP